MYTKTIACLAFAALATPAFAHSNPCPQPSLVSASVNAGAHSSVAAVTANVASPNALANVNANLLGGLVKADATVDQSSRQGNTLLGINLDLGGGVGNH